MSGGQRTGQLLRRGLEGCCGRHGDHPKQQGELDMLKSLTGPEAGSLEFMQVMAQPLT